MQGGVNHGVPNLSQKPIINGVAAPMPLILLVFSHIPEKSWDFFDESQQLSDSIVDALADLPLDYFSQPLKDQRAIKRQNCYQFCYQFSIRILLVFNTPP